MKPKLTLRDLFWLVLVVACLCGWWVNRIQIVRLFDNHADTLRLSIIFAENQRDALQRAVEHQGYEVEWVYRDSPKIDVRLHKLPSK